jgi:RNA polymerase sigma-70 factor, ECF subfamily
MTDPFSILAAEYRPMVLAYLRALVGDAHLAEDLTQETMIGAHESLDGFEPGGNFGNWLRGIARNKALMHWRSEKRHPLLVDSRVVEGIDEVFAGLDRNPAEIDWWESRKLALRDCIALLSGHLKAAVDSVYFGGNTLDQSAGILNATPAAVGQRLSRARTQIRECMGRKLQLLNGHG